MADEVNRERSTRRRPLMLFSSLAGVCVAALLANICLGSAPISLNEVWGALFGGNAERSVVGSIVWEFRFPRALTALLAGAALAVAGLAMQTVFRNPLADPFVLGVNSGASLGVAIVLMVLAPSGVALTEGLHLSGHLLVVVGAAGGAAVALAILLMLAQRVDVMSLLILGLMLSYGIGSIVSILMYYSMAERLQSFFNWSFGNFSAVTWSQLAIFGPTVVLGLGLMILLVKTLDAF